MDELKPSEVLKCMQLCGNALTCTTNDHECAYGDEGCMDCVDRLEADIQTLVDAGEDLIIRRPAPENKPLTLDELRQMDGEPVWVERYAESHYEYCGAQKVGEYRIVCIGVENDVRLYSIFNTISAKYVLDNDGRIYARKPEQEDNHA